VSGFLLSAALDRYSSREYLNKRVKNILKPYVLFATLFLLLDSAGAFFGQQKISDVMELPAFIASKVINTLFFTSYWFIFNYFISVMILLILRKYLYERWFGIVLFSCTMVYAVNVHFEVFIPHHTAAFVGFTFFLWLGANVRRREAEFWRFMETTPYWKFFAAVAVALGANLYETFYLLGKGATVVDSSLKFSNIIYCLTVVMLLCKVGRNVKFQFLNPRDETYPLYLIHPIFLKVINYAFLPMLPALGSLITIDQPSEVSWLMILLFQIGWFLFIYFISLVSVKIILNSPFRWVFGKQGKDDAHPAKAFRVLINGFRHVKFR
jgi:fucose 4-O-acetylase-like acetyltransferase